MGKDRVNLPPPKKNSGAAAIFVGMTAWHRVVFFLPDHPVLPVGSATE